VTRLRNESGGGEMKVEIAVEERIQEKRRVENKKWIGLNNVKE